MKTTELMIGDWVCYSKANVYATQVRSIRCTSDGDLGYIHCFRDNRDPLKEKYETDDFNTEILSPIPLTEEILRKNGWEYNDEDAKFFPQTWVGGGLKLQGADDCGYRIVVTSDYDDEDTNSTPFILLYVHELQHALRLRRIRKVIKL